MSAGWAVAHIGMFVVSSLLHSSPLASDAYVCYFALSGVSPCPASDRFRTVQWEGTSELASSGLAAGVLLRRRGSNGLPSQ